MNVHQKTSLYIVYLVSFLYLEFFFRFLLYDKVLDFNNIYMVIFLLFFTMVIFLLTKLFKEGINRIIYLLFIFVICLWFAAQYIVKDFMDFYISYSILQISDQVTSFYDKASVEIGKRALPLVMMFLPFIFALFFNNQFEFHRNKFKKTFLSIIVCALLFGAYYKALEYKKDENYSPYHLFHDINVPSLNIEKMGVINGFCLDVYRVIFGFNEKISDISKEEVSSNISYNNLDINFDKLLEENRDDIVKKITNYIKNTSGTNKNEYTGYFQNKNLIFFIAESFNEIALRKDIMPNLYKLKNEGFVFNNFYTPTIGSTIGGEFQELTSLYPNFSSFPIWRSGKNTFPMGIAKMFEEKGYNTYAYHDSTYNFQDRNVYLKSLGFNNYTGCGNGLETKINCRIFPQSDVEMIENTYSDYISSDKPFMVYYMTVSGHAGYDNKNSIVRKNNEEISKISLNYASENKAYLATQMELDKAIGKLLEVLNDNNKLDDTVIILLADHYPYELTFDDINELAGKEKDKTIEVNHSDLIIWNSKVNSKKVTKVSSSIDILPTIYNLFGISYDSRLFMGSDIFSNSEGLAIFENHSWISDKVKYFSLNNTSELGNASDEYIKNKINEVENKIAVSKYIIDKNYYKILENYIEK